MCFKISPIKTFDQLTLHVKIVWSKPFFRVRPKKLETSSGLLGNVNCNHTRSYNCASKFWLAISGTCNAVNFMKLQIRKLQDNYIEGMTARKSIAGLCTFGITGFNASVVLTHWGEEKNMEKSKTLPNLLPWRMTLACIAQGTFH